MATGGQLTGIRGWYTAVEVASVVVFGVSVAATPVHEASGDLLWLALWVGLIAAGVMLRIQVGHKTKMGVAFTPMYASILLLGPPLAMVATALGTAIALLVRPFGTPAARVFNGATLSLSVGLAGLAAIPVRSLLGVGHTANEIVSVVAVGIVLYLVNSLIVAFAVNIRNSTPLFAHYLENQRERLPNYLLLGVFGALAGIYGEDHRAALILTGIPMVIAGLQFSQFDQLRERFLSQVLTDPLTGLANRANFQESLDRAIRRSARRRASIALLYLDLDGFKDVNDRFGHLAGDQLLAAVAERIRDCLRKEDVAARLGGDEFAVLLDEPIDLSVAETIASRIVMQIGLPFSIAGQDISVSSSVGVARSRPGLDTADDLVKRADEAMYQAKSAGKSRYVVAAQDQISNRGGSSDATLAAA